MQRELVFKLQTSNFNQRSQRYLSGTDIVPISLRAGEWVYEWCERGKWDLNERNIFGVLYFNSIQCLTVHFLANKRIQNYQSKIQTFEVART
jgi:hypothetical protein